MKRHYHPFLLYAVMGLILEAIIDFWNIDYDAGGVRGWIFWIGQVFSFAFWIFSEILFSLNHGEAVRFHTAISAVSGLALCYLLDYVMMTLVKGRREHEDQ